MLGGYISVQIYSFEDDGRQKIGITSQYVECEIAVIFLIKNCVDHWLESFN